MERQGMLEITEGEYPLLHLTPFGSQVMFGEIEPEMAWPDESDGSAEHTDADIDHDLYHALVKKRNELAQSQKQRTSIHDLSQHRAPKACECPPQNGRRSWHRHQRHRSRQSEIGSTYIPQNHPRPRGKQQPETVVEFSEPKVTFP
jgi:hypothetical protein